LGNAPQALADYTKAIKIAPGFKEVYPYRADLYHYEGDDKRALADLEQVLRIDPTDEDARHNLEVVQEAIQEALKGDKK
jgi:tetratricopeptide (TPR) repeat protein